MTSSDTIERGKAGQTVAKLRVSEHGRLASIHREKQDESFIETRLQLEPSLQGMFDLKYLEEYISDETDEWTGGHTHDSGSGVGKRKQVYGLGAQSHRRLLRHVMALDLRQSVITFGLMYPNNFPEDPKQWHRHLEALKMRLVRRFSKKILNDQGKKKYEAEFAAIWRIGFELRKSGKGEPRAVPNIHIGLYLKGHEPAQLSRQWMGEFMEWLENSWDRIIGNQDKRHEQTSTCLYVFAHEEKEDVEFFFRYMAKPDTFDIAEYYPVGTGRVWGMWYKESLPMSPIIEIPLTSEQFDALQLYFKTRIWGDDVPDDLQYDALHYLPGIFEDLKLLLEQYPNPDQSQLDSELPE
jgi:hypothetical protein